MAEKDDTPLSDAVEFANPSGSQSRFRDQHRDELWKALPEATYVIKQEVTIFRGHEDIGVITDASDVRY